MRIIFVLFLLSAIALNADWGELQRIQASDADTDDKYGLPVDIDGDYAVVGAWCNEDHGDNSGSAYILKKEGDQWIEQVKLIPSDPFTQQWFGRAVSISGDYVLIGAPHDYSTGYILGKAYIYKRNGDDWIEQAILSASDAAADEWDDARFGNAVCIEENRILVGAIRSVVGEGVQGATYLFTCEDNEWQQQAKLTGIEGHWGSEFGQSVSISGEQAIIGATNYNACGAAYIFYENGLDSEEETAIENNSFNLTNYPNPFNPATTISFSLTAKSAKDAKLFIYNVEGQEIKKYSISNNKFSITWDGTDSTGNRVSSGIYFCCLQTGNSMTTGKMILLK